MTNEDWPPDYTALLAWRQHQCMAIIKDPALIFGALEYYRTKPVEFIAHWVDTYDPRVVRSGLPAYMPLVPFAKQQQLITFLNKLLDANESGLIDKSRDTGATWICGAFSIWALLFIEGVSVGWGSRKEQLVDRLGDMDSIFEKLRCILRSLPRFFLPVGFDDRLHAGKMKIINPANGASITGECGDQIGRGGRKSIYFKDESAWYEHPESIEAALSENTDCQIDLSTTAGYGTVFERKVDSGITYTGGDIVSGKVNVFILDWRDHPKKDLAWYNKKRSKAEGEGLLHIFAQEVDRDRSAALEGVVIPGLWVKAAVDAHLTLKWPSDEGLWYGGLDVADGGLDRDAFSARQGVILRECDDWRSADTGETTRKAILLVNGRNMIVDYDSVGVGAGVKAEYNRLKKEPDLKDRVKSLRMVAWNAGASPKDKDKRMIKGDKQSPLIGDFFANLKAQGWWELRRRFEKTYMMLMGKGEYEIEEMISIDSSIPKLHLLTKELSQPTFSQNSKLKMLIDKKPDGAVSPNLADSVVMNYFPLITSYTLANV